MRLVWIFALALLSVTDGARALTTGPSQSLVIAYPPSCLSAPLSDLPSGPTFSRTTQFATLDRRTSEYRGFEPVDFTFWRIACEGGKSALLVRITRAPNAKPSQAAQFPFLYGLVAAQGTITGTVRLAQEPNTQTSNLPPGALIDSSVTLVLENVPQDGAFSGVPAPALPPGVSASEFDFGQALNVTIPNPASVGLNPPPPPIVLSIPAYDRDLYPAAATPMPITGYNAGNYFDPAHSGEGMVVEIGDTGGQMALRQRYVAAAWFTFDENGKPFWIYGNTTFTPGDSIAVVPMVYLTGGVFAGASSASATQSPWGFVTISFPDCAAMHLSYAARSELPTPVPAGSGERTWARLTRPNGLACD